MDLNLTLERAVRQIKHSKDSNMNVAVIDSLQQDEEVYLVDNLHRLGYKADIGSGHAIISDLQHTDDSQH